MTALEGIIRSRATGIFNVSSGESHTVKEVIALTEAALHRKIAVRHVAAHSWDVHDSLLDNSKIQAAIGWRPVVTLAEGIRLAAASLETIRP